MVMQNAPIQVLVIEILVNAIAMKVMVDLLVKEELVQQIIIILSVLDMVNVYHLPTN